MRTATDLDSKIVNDDCVNALRRLQNASVDFVLTDPPYVFLYTDRSGRIVANEQSPQQVSETWCQVARVLKPNKLCFAFYSWAHIDTSAQAWTLAGLKPVGHIVFSRPYSTGQLYTRYAHECGYLLAKGTPTPPAHPLPDVMPWHYSGNRRHPTEKSVDTLKPIIEAFTQAGDLVLDPYAGSGSTLVASALLNRCYIGMEIDEKYCDGARRRLAGVNRHLHLSASTP